MKVVYTAGKYSGNINENIAQARKVAIELWEAGLAVICPHLNTANFEVDCLCEYDDYMSGDLSIIKNVDAVIMLPSWHESKGANLEHDFALRNKIPVYYYPTIPEALFVKKL